MARRSIIDMKLCSQYLFFYRECVCLSKCCESTLDMARSLYFICGRHDARRDQAEQGEDDPAAPERGVALLEGEHTVEGAGFAYAYRKHDPEICEGQG